MNRISQKGYSTKGKGRGLGLYSYQEITQQYQNVSCAAFCKSGRFLPGDQNWRISIHDSDIVYAMMTIESVRR